MMDSGFYVSSLLLFHFIQIFFAQLSVLEA